MFTIITSTNNMQPLIIFFLEQLFYRENIITVDSVIKNDENFSDLEKSSNFQIVICTSNNRINDQKNVKFFETSIESKPLRPIINFLKEKRFITSLSNKFIETNSQLIDLIDQRVTNSEFKDSFFDSLINYRPEIDNSINSLRAKISYILSGVTSIDEIKELANIYSVATDLEYNTEIINNVSLNFFRNRSYTKNKLLYEYCCIINFLS